MKNAFIAFLMTFSVVASATTYKCTSMNPDFTRDFGASINLDAKTIKFNINEHYTEARSAFPSQSNLKFHGSMVSTEAANSLANIFNIQGTELLLKVTALDRADSAYAVIVDKNGDTVEPFYMLCGCTYLSCP